MILVVCVWILQSKDSLRGDAIIFTFQGVAHLMEEAEHKRVGVQLVRISRGLDSAACDSRFVEFLQELRDIG